MLFDLIVNDKFCEAIGFLNDDSITPQNKTAKVNWNDSGNNTTLMVAALHGAPLTLINALCEIGGKPLIVATNYMGMTALHMACRSSSDNHNILDAVQFLFQNGGEEIINKIDNDGFTALNYACKRTNPNIEVVEYLSDGREFDTKSIVDLIKNENGVPLDYKMRVYSFRSVGRSVFSTEDGILQWDKLIQNFTIGKLSEMNISSIATVPVSKTARYDIVEHIGNINNQVVVKKWVSFINDPSKCSKESILWLTKLKSISGRSLQDVAHKDIKDVIAVRTLFMGQYRFAMGPSLHKSDTAEVKQAFDRDANIRYQKIYADAVSNTRTAKERPPVYARAVSNTSTAKEGLSFDDFKKLLNLVPEVRDWKKTDKDEKEVFDHLDADKNGMISEDEWVHHCMGYEEDGEGRKVAIKFMGNKEQFQKEMKEDRLKEGHLQEGKTGVIRILKAFNVEGGSDDDKRFAKAMKEEHLQYEYAIVMPFGDRSLDDIYRSERPTELQIRGFLSDICDCLIVLHSANIIHGDLKMANVVRFAGRMELIDLDASATVATSNEKHTLNADNYNGSKVSSGIVPPEMIHTFEEDDQFNNFDSYFENEKDNNTILWKKFKARDAGYMKSYAVKTFLIKAEAKPWHGDHLITTKFKGDVERLPYKLVPAHTSQDMWALGVMLYALLTGEKLFAVDRNEDLASPAAYYRLATWDDKKKKNKLQRVTNPYANELLMMLLSEDPEDRGCVGDVRGHKFLNVDSTSDEYQKLSKILKNNIEIQRKILKNTHYIRREINSSAERIMNSVFEATDVDTPTCFILLPYRDNAEDERRDILQAAQNVVDNLSKVIKKVESDGVLHTHGLLNSISDKFMDLVVGKREKMYLYLIDEHTGKPISHGMYPIEINVASKEVKKWVPVMMVGWKSIFLLNSTFAVASMFFPGIPSVNRAVLEKIGDKIENIRSSGSGLIDKAIDSTGDVKSVRGAQLREFSQYLLEVDSKKTFAGLCRVCDYTNGNAIWVTEASKGALEPLALKKHGLLQMKNDLQRRIHSLERHNTVLELRLQRKNRFVFNCTC